MALALPQYASPHEATVYEVHRAAAQDGAYADLRPSAVQTGAVGFGLRWGLW